MRNLKYILLSMTLTTLLHAESLPVYFGTSQGRNNGSKGIYATNLDTTNGKLAGVPELVAELVSPGFLVLHDTKPILYSVGTGPTNAESSIYSFKVQSADGKPVLNPINSQPTGCERSAHLDVDKKGRMLVCAQYGDGTISVFPLKKDGSLLPTSQTIRHTFSTNADPKRQDKPHPHNVTFDPSGNYALVPDLGADMVYVYKADFKTNQLSLHDKVKTDPASGPRHMKFSSDGKNAYVLNELSLTVDAFKWNATSGKLSHLATVEGLPNKMRNPEVTTTASEIRIHPSGKFLYTANRGHNSISVFSIDPKSKIPSRIEIVPAEVKIPRNFSLDPSGNWLICGGQVSNEVVVFSIDPDSGRLKFLSGSNQPVPGPICVLPVN